MHGTASTNPVQYTQARATLHVVAVGAATGNRQVFDASQTADTAMRCSKAVPGPGPGASACDGVANGIDAVEGQLGVTHIGVECVAAVLLQRPRRMSRFGRSLCSAMLSTLPMV